MKIDPSCENVKGRRPAHPACPKTVDIFAWLVLGDNCPSVIKVPAINEKERASLPNIWNGIEFFLGSVAM